MSFKLCVLAVATTVATLFVALPAAHAQSAQIEPKKSETVPAMPADTFSAFVYDVLEATPSLRFSRRKASGQPVGATVETLASASGREEPQGTVRKHHARASDVAATQVLRDSGTVQ